MPSQSRQITLLCASLLTVGSIMSHQATAQVWSVPIEYSAPPYSSLTLRPHVIRIDNFDENPKGLGIAFEQRIARQFFLSGSAYETAVTVANFDDRLHVRDYQLGAGWFMPVAPQLFVDTALTFGQHAQNLPGLGPLPDEEPIDPDDPDAEPPVPETLLLRSDYIGLRAQLRGTSGPFEGTVGAEYVYFNGNGPDTERRLHAAILFNLTPQAAIGFRYQDNETYNISSLELRVRF